VPARLSTGDPVLVERRTGLVRCVVVCDRGGPLVLVRRAGSGDDAENTFLAPRQQVRAATPESADARAGRQG